MKSKLKELLQRAESWPEAVQDEAVRSLLAIEEAQGGPYRISDAEWADMQQAIDEADRGELVSEEALMEANKRHGA